MNQNFNFGGIDSLAGMGVIGGMFGGMNIYEQQSSSGSKTHLGIASCNLMKEYVTTYPCLREVALLLKCFLANLDLNSAYHGK